MKPFIKNLFILCFLAFSLVGCDQLGSYERDIKKATQAISVAKDDLARAQAFDQRGQAYAEKARYSHFRKLVSPDQYAQLFALALADHNKAIELAPQNADVYFGRGKSYYFRAAYVEMPLGSEEITAGARTYFDLAMADFNKATELDTDHYFAFDMKGLVDMAVKNYDQAIVDFTQAMRIDPVHGKPRVSDAYCTRGSFYHRQQQLDAAIADYQKSMELYAQADGCSCEPFNALVGIYAEKGEYAKGWEVIEKAKNAKVGISSDIIEKLKKATNNE